VISNIAFTAAHQEVIYDVSLAFYAHAAAYARLATARQSLENARAVQGAADDRYKRGVGTVVEATQARQATAQANLALVQATGGMENAYITLISAMGISPLTKIRIADVSGRRLSPALTAPVDSIISESLSHRPDVLSAYAAARASLANVQAARAESFPKFFFSTTGAYNSGGLNLTAIPSVGQQAATVNLNGSHFGGSILAGVTVPLYDGGTRAAVLAQARAAADSAEARLTRVRYDAVRQIVLADNALRTGLSAVSASEALRTAAQTTFDAALAAYRNGIGAVTDVTRAQSQLLQSRNAFTDAYSTALSAAATLALATGALGRAPQ
jgi:outer membrane protein TolC